MMTRLLLFMLLTASASAVTLRVTGDRVNLRAGPGDKFEVITQVSVHDALETTSPDEEWVPVTPPAGSVIWIHSDLVKDCVITATKARYRAGPGITYTILGTLEQNDRVTVRGTFNDWIKIDPPGKCVFWISRLYVEPMQEIPSALPPPAPEMPPSDQAGSPVQPPTRVTVPPAEPYVRPPPRPVISDTLVTPSRVAVPVAQELPPGISQTMLLPAMAQGQIRTFEGILRKTVMAWGSPSRFRLIGHDGQDDKALLCMVIGNPEQLDAVVGRTMSITGKQYWIQGERRPVLDAQRIVMKP